MTTCRPITASTRLPVLFGHSGLRRVDFFDCDVTTSISTCRNGILTMCRPVWSVGLYNHVMRALQTIRSVHFVVWFALTRVRITAELNFSEVLLPGRMHAPRTLLKHVEQNSVH